MLSLRKITKGLKRAVKTIDDSREAIEGAGELLQSAADLCRSAGQKAGGAVELGQRIGGEFIEGVRKLTTPAPLKVDVKVTGVKVNGK